MALGNVFGSHMVMRLEMEKKLLSTHQRLPVLKSEFAGLDTVTQNDLTIGLEDAFGGNDDVIILLKSKIYSKVWLCRCLNARSWPQRRALDDGGTSRHGLKATCFVDMIPLTLLLIASSSLVPWRCK